MCRILLSYTRIWPSQATLPSRLNSIRSSCEDIIPKFNSGVPSAHPFKGEML